MGIYKRDAKRPTIEYFRGKFPKLMNNGAFAWQCAYADYYDGSSVLYAQVYCLLHNYDSKNDTSLEKYYKSADVAIRDILESATLAIADWEEATRRTRRN